MNGEYVHTVGNLQMNVTNWGFLGSLPNSQLPMSDSPSAQWPPGSGIEYLYAAGLWVGARLKGLPVVSTRHAGIPECADDGVSGFLAEEGDVDGIGNALDRILSIPEHWGEFGERGRAIVEERFAMRRCAAGLLEHYRAAARRGENV